MTIIRVYWREAVEDSEWLDVVSYSYHCDGTQLRFCTPTGANHIVNVNATQLIIIQEK